MADKETKEDYKARVQKAKRIVQKMFVEGQKKEIPMYKIERDVESFLDSQNLTKFDLRTNGDRKNQAVLQAFTNKANKGIMEILKVIAPSVAVQLDLKKLGILKNCLLKLCQAWRDRFMMKDLIRRNWVSA